MICYRFYFTKTLYLLAICKNSCRNNGTCVHPDVCDCTPQWNGTICDQGKKIYTLRLAASSLLGVSMGTRLCRRLPRVASVEKRRPGVRRLSPFGECERVD